MLHDKEKIRRILAETVVALCNTGVDFISELSVEGLLGITVDQKEVFLVNIKEVIKTSLSDVSLKSTDEIFPRKYNGKSSTDVLSSTSSVTSKPSTSHTAFADSSSEFVYQVPEDVHENDRIVTTRQTLTRPHSSLIGSSRRKRKTPINHLRTGVVTYKNEAKAPVKEEKFDFDTEVDLSRSIYSSESAELAAIVGKRRTEECNDGESPAKKVHHIRGSRFYSREDSSSGEKCSKFPSPVAMGIETDSLSSVSLSWTDTTEREFQQQLGNIAHSRLHDFGEEVWSSQFKRGDGSDFSDFSQFSSIAKKVSESGLLTSSPFLDSQSLFKCPYCSFTTKRNFNLRRHVNMHTGQGFGCPYCGRKFTCEHYMKNQHLPKCPVHQQAIAVSISQNLNSQAFYDSSSGPFVLLETQRAETEADDIATQKNSEKQYESSSSQEPADGEESSVKKEPSDAAEANSNTGESAEDITSKDHSHTDDDVYMID